MATQTPRPPNRIPWSRPNVLGLLTALLAIPAICLLLTTTIGADDAQKATDPESAPGQSDMREEMLATRATLRAYDGAPPVIPHAVADRGRVSCLTCHGEGRVFSLRSKPAPIPSHGPMENCHQCHVETNEDSGFPPNQVADKTKNPDGVVYQTPIFVENGFIGIPSPGPGHRSYDGAPPVMPHRPELRENCHSCHGSNGWMPIAAPHPWRSNCIQCHTRNAAETDLPVLESLDKPPFSQIELSE